MRNTIAIDRLRRRPVSAIRNCVAEVDPQVTKIWSKPCY